VRGGETGGRIVRGANSAAIGRARYLRRTQTNVERKLWYRFNNRQLAGHKFVRQESIGPYIVDFVCRERRLVVELDGSQHAESQHDQKRDMYLAAQGYRVMRFWDHEINQNLDGILETILVTLRQTELAPHPTLSPQAGRGDAAAAS